MKRGGDFHLRLSSEIAGRLSLLASERGVSRNLIVQSALEEFLQIGGGEDKKKMTIEDLRKDLYEVKRRLVALREDVEIVGELLSFYIYHWIGYTPRLEREERLSLAVEAKERHDRFLRLFAKQLATGEVSLAAVFGAGQKLEPGDIEENSVSASGEADGSDLGEGLGGK